MSVKVEREYDEKRCHCLSCMASKKSERDFFNIIVGMDEYMKKRITLCEKCLYDLKEQS